MAIMMPFEPALFKGSSYIGPSYDALILTLSYIYPLLIFSLLIGNGNNIYSSQ